MNDFISLSCPACGGNLQVGANTTVLKCQHCGTEHIIRRQGNAVTIESYARCPKCGRNDRVEKVSSILKSQTQEIITIEKRTETYLDKDGVRKTRTTEVPVTQTQVTGLAKLLIPPWEPKLKSKPASLPKPEFEPKPEIPKPTTRKKSIKTKLLPIGAILVSVFTCITAIYVPIYFDEPIRDNLICSGVSVIFLGIGIGILVFSSKLTPKEKDEIKKWEKENASAIDKWEKENEKKLKAWEEENQKRKEEWQQFNARVRESWEYAMENWDNLYFCYRDDCVFVPGKGTYAPIEEYDKYLYE